MSNNRIQTSFILNQSCVLGAVAESMLHARVDFAAPKKWFSSSLLELKRDA
jgi:hypothetical protein